MAQAASHLLDISDLVTHTVQFAGHRLAVSNFAQDRLLNGYIEHHHVWEPWQLNLMTRAITPDSICVDAGANIGINAMFAGLLCPKGRVLAYEPFDQIEQLLRHNIEQNHLTNVVAIDKGLSDFSGPLAMAADPQSVGKAHVVSAEDDGKEYSTATAHFARLDDELRRLDIDRIDFIKIDVEGHELQVLAGGKDSLRDPDLQLVIEFSPDQQRRAMNEAGAFADVRLFAELRGMFRHIFYMTREYGLLEMRDWHAVRRRLMGGYFVDDLYCVNRIRPEISDLITTGPHVQPNVHVTRQTLGSLSIVYYNRDPDGWAMAEPFNPPTVSMTIEGPPQALSLKFDRIYRKHLPPEWGGSSWPLYVMLGPEQYRLDLLDQPAEIFIRTTGEPLDITLQSDEHTTAAHYLGNPGDPRLIGFRFVPVR